MLPLQPHTGHERTSEADDDHWPSSPTDRFTVRSGPEFETWWNQHDVLGSGAGHKILHQPGKGRRAYDHATFQANEDPALKLTIYTPTRR